MKKKEMLYRVVTFLNRDELDFLDTLVKDLYFKYRIKVPRAKLIEEVIGEFKDKGTATKQELIDRILCLMHDKVERRQYPRLKTSMIVGFRRLESMDEYKKCVSENISMGGLKLDVPSVRQPVSINQVIELMLKSPGELGEPVKAMGRVAWVKEKKDAQGFEIGLMLTYVRKEDKERFTQYLNQGAKVNIENKA